MDPTAPRLFTQALFAESALNAIADAVYLLDLAGNLIDCNETALAMLGYTRQELLGQHFSFLRSPHDTTRAQEQFETVIAQGHLQTELFHRSAQGRDIPMEVHSRTLTLDGVGYVLTVARDISQRRDTERQLEFNRRWLELLFENSGTMNGFYDPEGRLVLCNSASLKLLGASTFPEVAGRLVSELLPSTLGQEIQANIQRVATTSTPETHVRELSTPEGTHYLRTTYLPLWDSSKELSGVQMVGTDITELKLQEQELRRVNKLYALLGEFGLSLARQKSAHGLYEEFCRIAVKTGGFPLVMVAVMDRKNARAVPTVWAGRSSGYAEGLVLRLDDEPEGWGPTGRCYRTRKFFYCQDTESDPDILPWRTRTRQWGIRCLASFPIFLHDEVVASFTIYSEQPKAFSLSELEMFDKAAADLSFGLERFHAEEAVEANWHRYEQMFEQSRSANALFDGEGRLLLQNRLFAKLTHPQTEHPLGQRPEKLLPGDFGKAFGLWLSLVAQAGTEESYEGVFKIQGEERTWQCSFVPFFDRDGNLESIQAVSQDITEERQLAEQLRQAQKLESIGVLAGGIAHDFNNLLGGIFGYLEVAQFDLTKENYSSAREKLLKAREVMARARSLTSQLLTFSKGAHLVRKPLHFGHLLPEWTEFALAGSDLAFSVTVEPELWLCLGDEALLSQVINNLVLNARQASYAGGNILVKAYNIPPASLGISITDQGVGIPPSVIDRIFEPFFTTKRTGSGLGLATSYSIIQRHGGKIDVRSTPGKGTTMVVILPAEPQALAEDLPREVLSILHLEGLAVVMDDQESFQESLRELLTSIGMDVRTASKGEAVLNLYEDLNNAGKKVSLGIFDLTVPGGLGGYETAHQLRERGCTAKIIGMSGYSEDPITEGQVFDARLTKPFTWRELLEVLARLFQTE